MRDRFRRTKGLEFFPKPVQSHNYYCDVDESKICDHGNQISIDLLVRRQFFQVNTLQMRQVLAVIKQWSVYQAGSTYVFRPDSVEALTPKKYASMAEMLPCGSSMSRPERPARMIYKSVAASVSSSETMSHTHQGVTLTV